VGKQLLIRIFVTQFIFMNTILLSIGSNTYAKTNIDKAKRMLTTTFEQIQFSEPILSEPDDDRYKYLFRNILAIARTNMTQEEIIDKTKTIERAVGRTPRDKYSGKMVIDIDLLQFNNDVLRPEDMEKIHIQRLLEIFVIEEFPEYEEKDSDESKTDK
jgi:2-amino-4-hydroxy-6-hydroxymethyldihydropteridine diphosphokinase